MYSLILILHTYPLPYFTPRLYPYTLYRYLKAHVRDWVKNVITLVAQSGGVQSWGLKRGLLQTLTQVSTTPYHLFAERMPVFVLYILIYNKPHNALYYKLYIYTHATYASLFIYILHYYLPSYLFILCRINTHYLILYLHILCYARTMRVEKRILQSCRGRGTSPSSAPCSAS